MWVKTIGTKLESGIKLYDVKEDVSWKDVK